jgi:glycosyltransferase involved in cell wall biosynthesis
VAPRSVRGPFLLLPEQNARYRDDRPPWMETLKRIGLPPLFRRTFGLHTGWLNREWYLEYGMSPDRLFFVPNAVDNEGLRSEAGRLRPQRAAILRSLGVDPSAGPVILFVGRLVPKKQPQLLVEAFRRVRAANRCSLLIVGSGGLEGELRQLVMVHDVPDVSLAGFLNQSELPKAYACADIFVLPSGCREDWGMVVNEAMNFGLPIVVTDKVGCADVLVRDQLEGHVVSSSDVEELATRLSALVVSEKLRRRLGDAARERVSAWNYDAAAAGVLDAVAGAVGPSRWRAAQPVGGRHAYDPDERPATLAALGVSHTTNEVCR